jgi:hypothetical protein
LEIERFIEQSGLRENGITQMSLEEWQDQCGQIALGIRNWVSKLELRLASMESSVKVRI